MTLRKKQADFCQPCFVWLFSQWCFRPWGVQEKRKPCGSPSVTTSIREKVLLGNLCVDDAVGFQPMSTRWHQVTDACKTFCRLWRALPWFWFEWLKWTRRALALSLPLFSPAALSPSRAEAVCFCFRLTAMKSFPLLFHKVTTEMEIKPWHTKFLKTKVL